MYRKLVVGAMVEAKSKVHARTSLVSAMALPVGSGEYLVTGIELCHLEAAELSCQRVAFFGNCFSVQASTTEGWTL